MCAAKEEGFEYQSVQTLKGVGPAVAEKLARLDIHCIQDLLFHLPMRYEDRTRVVPIGSLRAGMQAVIEGVIEHSEVRFRKAKKGHGGRMLLCYLSDNSGGIVLRFFHFSKAQQDSLCAGTRVRCFGEVRYGASSLEMMHPEYRRIADDIEPPVDETLTPVYPKTEGVNQYQIRNFIHQVLNRLDDTILSDWLPDDFLQQYGFDGLVPSLKRVHNPLPDDNIASFELGQHKSQQRLIFEELLAHQLSLIKLRKHIRKTRAHILKLDEKVYLYFIERLGFELTAAQKRVAAEILDDLAQPVPMLRLLQGDVGSGKTVVAAIAALAGLGNDKQVAIMAPTEILAEQHYQNFSGWFDRKRPNCLLLTGKHRGAAREQKLAMIKNGDIKIIIGTHALFQQDVEFNNLAVVIVDEQHRFGVHQRLSLHEKGRRGMITPHQLIMTATPIPRSLAMTAYADLDYSALDELPPGRKPVSTVVVSAGRRQQVIDRVANACKRGEQAYWVCTLIEESEVLQCQAAEDTAKKLHDELQALNIGLVHGRMKQEQKDQVVSRFKAGEIDLLVATTVIEVGVDVPNASLMVIENAERLGLAQLHQLRGRVGRGSKQSACVLMYQPPLSEQGKQRLAILRETSSGFDVAEKDLQMRGPGEVLGTRQTGLMQMRIADIVRDEKILPEVRAASQMLLERHPERVGPLIRRWLGTSDRFGSV